MKGKQLVLAIGNSGSGKSTMLTSLAFGPEALHEIDKVEEIVVQARGDAPAKMKRIKQRVIE